MSKLIYMPLHARASSIRMLLSHGRVEFTDEVISREEFRKRKAQGEFPNGQVPVFIHEGRMLNESVAILRLLGKKHGYYPEDDILLAWDADATVDYCNEVYAALYRVHLLGKHTDETKKTYADKIQALCDFFENKLQKSGTTFICSSKLTIGDFHLASILFNFIYNDSLGGGEDYTSVGKKIVAEHEALSAYVDRLRAELKDYLATRGAYPF